jgi:outer membrane protein OmpA-like peptidoglycan-associated protein
MADQSSAARRAHVVAGRALLAAGLIASGAVAGGAMPRLHPDGPAPRVTLIQEAADPGPSATGQSNASGQQAPFAELNQALAAARARLEELAKAAAVAASAGQAREEVASLKEQNRQLAAEVAALRADRDGLQSAGARIGELTKAAEAAAAEAKRIEAELVTMRWQNAQLNTSLARAQAARDRAEADARKNQQVLASKVAALTEAAERSAAEIADLRAQLAARDQDIASAASARSGTEAHLAELQETVRNAKAESSGLGEQLDRLRTQLAQAEQERDQARQESSGLRAETERVTSVNRQLEREVGQLRSAASSATDAARQNLVAVESRIKELNAALTGVEPVANPTAGIHPGLTETAMPDGGARRSAASPEPIDRAAATEEASAAPQALAALGTTSAASAPVPPPRKVDVAATLTPDPAVDADLDLVKSGGATSQTLGPALPRLIADLPLEPRLQVQSLLVDLDGKVDQRGLMMTVPGAELFAINSDAIEPTAYDALAKVAELIGVYKDRRVLIVGHTDAIGDASYNKNLSERRARLVKKFLIDNFAVDGSRLATQGLGEAQPIASNDTSSGREANRRVEVLILN